MSATVLLLDGLKGRQQRMWASGDYAAVAARIHPIAERLCTVADLVPGARVLDVATGSGNAAIVANHGRSITLAATWIANPSADCAG
jgi:hypothetical protein